MSKQRINAMEFVKAWDVAESIDEVAKKLGAPIASLRTKAYQYRKKGVDLKYFASTRGGKKLDIAELNAVLKNGAGSSASGSKSKRAKSKASKRAKA